MLLSYLNSKKNLDFLQNITAYLAFIQSDEAKELFLSLQNEDFDDENPTEDTLKILESLAKAANLALAFDNIANILPDYVFSALTNIKNKLTEDKLFELSDKMFDNLFEDETKLNILVEDVKNDISNGVTHEISVLCPQK